MPRQSQPPTFPEYDRLIRRCPPMSRVRERWIILLAQSGDQRAKEIIVGTYLRLAMAESRRLHRWMNLPLEDALEYALVGLLNALERFELDRHLAFGTFAGFYFRAAIQHGARGWYAKMGPRDYTRRTEENTRHVSHASELADMNGAFSGSGESMTWEQLFPARPAENRRLEDQERAAAVQAWLRDSLPDIRQRDIVARRYGLHGDEPATLQQVADVYDISKERVRQLEERATIRLVRFRRKLPRGLTA